MLWNAGRVVSTYLETHTGLVLGKRVLELGAGAGLPSLVCALRGAEEVCFLHLRLKSICENDRYCITLRPKHKAGFWQCEIEALFTNAVQLGVGASFTKEAVLTGGW